MAKTFRAGFGLRLGNRFVAFMNRLGLGIGIISMLTIHGRKSGEPRTTPVVVIERDGKRYLVAAYGIVDWALNLRTAGAAILTRGRHAEAITVHELSPQEAAPILKDGLGPGTFYLRPYFNSTPSSPLAVFEKEAERHSVFEVIPAEAHQVA
jgi:deazaflavin-dependent oxidoreductase (nitroreductase family)